ncbi:MAG: hypothetical protein ACJAZO_004589 [Myxococcota bacterium]
MNRVNEAVDLGVSVAAMQANERSGAEYGLQCCQISEPSEQLVGLKLESKDAVGSGAVTDDARDV